MAYCVNCGCEIKESDKFCPNCGAPVNKKEQGQSVYVSENWQQENNSMSKKLNGRGTAILVLGILSLALNFLGSFRIASIVLGIVGIALYSGYRKQAQEIPGSVRAGFVMSIIGLSLCVVLIVLSFLGLLASITFFSLLGEAMAS